MSILKVARLGHPILRQVAKPVKESVIRTPEFQKFVDDMIQTMHEYDGVGLAAPQVHESIRVSVIQFEEDNPRYNIKGASGLHVFINPEVTPLTDEEETYWEGCLSVPGLRGLVSRPNKVGVKYLDRNGKKRELTAEGFLATVVQHEFDHLDGKVYIDRLVDSTQLVFEQEFDKYVK